MSEGIDNRIIAFSSFSGFLHKGFGIGDDKDGDGRADYTPSVICPLSLLRGEVYKETNRNEKYGDEEYDPYVFRDEDEKDEVDRDNP